MMKPTVEKVGFIGVGTMGGAMVSRIIDAGFPTVLWARRSEALAAFTGPNVETAATPAALAAAVDLVGICVWSDDDVREVVAGEHGVLAGARPGTVIAIHSTILPSTCRELADLAAARDVLVLDAPVTGGPNVALAGALTVAVGGDEGRARARSAGVRHVCLDRHSSRRCGRRAGGEAAQQRGPRREPRGRRRRADPRRKTLVSTRAVLAEFLRLGSGRSYAVDVAMMIRASDETRAAALPALEKDLPTLVAESSELDGGRLLRDAAERALLHLRRPLDEPS